MAYTPINLGDLYQQANQIKRGQQAQAMGDLQLQQAQQAQSDQQGIDSAIQANPNVSLGDLASKYGMAGVKASGDLNQARGMDLTSRYRQLYTTAAQVAGSDDPIGTVHQLAPGFAQQYDQAHGQGAFAKLTPDQVKQQAEIVKQQAQAGLIDPEKQFQADQKRIEDHYKQEGPGGELQRAQMTQAGENQRTLFTQGQENTRAAQGRTVTMRGQDLANTDRGIPAGYERDPEKPGALRPIAGGPHDPNAVSAGMDSRSSVMFNRVAASANEAVTALKNIAELPVTTSTGWFGSAQAPTTLMGSVKGVLSQKITSQEAQDYKTMIAGVARSLSTIETAGLAPNGSITHSMESITLNEGDSQLTKLRKLAETRQIIEKGIEPNLSNPKLAPAQRDLINKIVSEVQGAIPFTQHDITKLQQSKNPKATLMDFAAKSGLPKQEAASTAPVKVSTPEEAMKLPPGTQFITPDGRTKIR